MSTYLTSNTTTKKHVVINTDGLWLTDAGFNATTLIDAGRYTIEEATNLLKVFKEPERIGVAA
tara:strand:- start:23 stop:211 length:189 start_codon:yes stop_codon:yes gene_type:complete